MNIINLLDTLALGICIFLRWINFRVYWQTALVASAAMRDDLCGKAFAGRQHVAGNNCMAAKLK